LLLHHFIDQKTRHLRLTLVLFSTPRYASENFMTEILAGYNWFDHSDGPKYAVC
jgi:hypothetical protein